MYGHPFAMLESRAAIRSRLLAGAVYFFLGMAAAVVVFQLGIWDALQ